MDELDPKTHTEYSGPVGFEKKIRQTHWGVIGASVRNNLDTGYKWIKIAPGRYKRVREEV